MAAARPAGSYAAANSASESNCPGGLGPRAGGSERISFNAVCSAHKCLPELVDLTGWELRAALRATMLHALPVPS